MQSRPRCLIASLTSPEELRVYIEIRASQLCRYTRIQVHARVRTRLMHALPRLRHTTMTINSHKRCVLYLHRRSMWACVRFFFEEKQPRKAYTVSCSLSDRRLSARKEKRRENEGSEEDESSGSKRSWIEPDEPRPGDRLEFLLIIQLPVVGRSPRQEPFIDFARCSVNSFHQRCCWGWFPVGCCRRTSSSTLAIGQSFLHETRGTRHLLYTIKQERRLLISCRGLRFINAN